MNIWIILRHPHLDRLAALPQSHLTGLLRLSGDRRDYSCSYQTIYLHRDRNINPNSSGNLLTKLIHTLNTVPAIFSCVFQQASLGWSLSLCSHWTPGKTVHLSVWVDETVCELISGSWSLLHYSWCRFSGLWSVCFSSLSLVAVCSSLSDSSGVSFFSSSLELAVEESRSMWWTGSREETIQNVQIFTYVMLTVQRNKALVLKHHLWESGCLSGYLWMGSLCLLQ